MITLPPRNIVAMKRERRSKPDDANGGFDAWLLSTGEALERKLGITRAAIRQRMWNDLYIGRATPDDAADRAAAHYRNRQTPKDSCGAGRTVGGVLVRFSSDPGQIAAPHRAAIMCQKRLRAIAANNIAIQLPRRHWRAASAGW
jgi:hypothetical protein